MTLKELLEYLDGAGLIVTDYDEIEQTLGWFDSNLESTVQLDGEEL